ncbi:S-layer protein [Paenibacillus mucilaginosus K02]|uniref:S-layer protein n=2 Tax=Paenibacillus mucilaginosus TaxID=61624 RepID=I0BES0_9BACL|nr:S-layer protein [Paenibacillus mucilaginosus K02]
MNATASSRVKRFTYMIKLLLCTAIVLAGAVPLSVSASAQPLPDLVFFGENPNTSHWGAEVQKENDLLPFDASVAFNGHPAHRVTNVSGGWWGIGMTLQWTTRDISGYIPYGALEFELKGSRGGELLQFSLSDGRSPAAETGTVPAAASPSWNHVTIPLAQFPQIGSFPASAWNTLLITKVNGEDLNTLWLSDMKFTSRYITRYEPLNMTAPQGTVPAMPSVVTAVYSDSTTTEVPVTWSGVPDGSAAGAFTVQGHVAGVSVQPTAEVTVGTEADQGTGSEEPQPAQETPPAVETPSPETVPSSGQQEHVVFEGGRTDQYFGSGGSLKLETDLVSTSSLPVDSTVEGTYNGQPSYKIAVTKLADPNWGYWNGVLAADGWTSYSLEAFREGTLEFYVKGAAGGEDFVIGIMDTNDVKSVLSLSGLAQTVTTDWSLIRIPLSRFTEQAPDLELSIIDKVVLENASTQGEMSVWLNRIKFTQNPAAELEIASVDPVKAVTVAGLPPELPQEVPVTYENGTTGTASVSWEESDGYRIRGRYTVRGTILQDTGPVPVTAEVTVVRALSDEPHVIFLDKKKAQWASAEGHFSLGMEQALDDQGMPVTNEQGNPVMTLPVDPQVTFGGLPAYRLQVTRIPGPNWGYWGTGLTMDNWNPVNLEALYERGSLDFMIKGLTGGESFSVVLTDRAGALGTVKLSDVAAVTTGWRQVSIPLKRLVPVSSAHRLKESTAVTLTSDTGTGAAPLTVWLSDMRFTSEASREVVRFGTKLTVPASQLPQLPVLPATAEAVYNDGTAEQVPVAWDAVTFSSWGYPNPVQGTAQGIDLPATLQFTVEGSRSSGSSGSGSGSGSAGMPEEPEAPIAVPVVPAASSLYPNGAAGTYTLPALKPAVDPADALLAVVNVQPGALKEGYKAAAPGPGQRPVMHIKVPYMSGVTGYAVKLPAGAVSGAYPDAELSVTTDLGRVVLPADLLNPDQLNGAAAIRLVIRRSDTADMKKTAREQVGGRTVLDIHLEADGVILPWESREKRVLVSPDYAPTDEELEHPERLVILYLGEDGEAEPVPSGRYDRTGGRMIFSAGHFSRYAVAWGSRTFGDLAGYGWAQEAVELLASRGIVQGTGPAEFAPGRGVTRAEFVSLLVRTLDLAGLPAEADFRDVDPSSPHYQAIAAAARLGIAGGIGGGLFAPDAPVSRQDVIVLTERALERAGRLHAGAADSLPSGVFRDAEDLAGYAVPAVSALYGAGLIEGAGGLLRPEAEMSRAEAAVLLNRIYPY